MNKKLSEKSEKVIKAIVKLVKSTKDKEIELECAGNYPILPDETIVLYDEGVTRFAGERDETYSNYTSLNDGEVEVLIDALEENDYTIEIADNGDYTFIYED